MNYYDSGVKSVGNMSNISGGSMIPWGNIVTGILGLGGTLFSGMYQANALMKAQQMARENWREEMKMKQEQLKKDNLRNTMMQFENTINKSVLFKKNVGARLPPRIGFRKIRDQSIDHRCGQRFMVQIGI